MMHKLRKADGIRFLTRGTICTDDIIVVPELQTLEVDQRGIYTADEGYVGIGEINVNIPEVTTEEAEVTPSTGTQYVTPNGADYLSKVTVLPIPSTYVPDGYVPEGTIPDGYVPEGTVPDGYVPEGTVPEGYVPKPVLKSKKIIKNGTYKASDDGADGYSSVTVEVPNSGGSRGSGTCSGKHIIEVDELPTEAVDDNTFYLCNGILYRRPHKALVDVLGVEEDGGALIDLPKYLAVYGVTVTCNAIPERTTDGVKESSAINELSSSTILHIYYIENEDGLYVYTLGEWVLFDNVLGVPYLDTINDKSEITSTAAGYYAVIRTVWDEYHEGVAIIEVAELPTENINNNVLYFCNGNYYMHGDSFDDIVMSSPEYGLTLPFSLLLQAFGGGTCEFHVIQTKTTEGVLESDPDNDIYHFYYIKDEESCPVYIYSGDMWFSLEDMMASETGIALLSTSMYSAELAVSSSYLGNIQSISEAVLEGYYVLANVGWTKYARPIGAVTITKNNIYDVSYFKHAVVAIPEPPKSYSLPRTLDELPEDAVRGSLAFVFGGE